MSKIHIDNTNPDDVIDVILMGHAFVEQFNTYLDHLDEIVRQWDETNKGVWHKSQMIGDQDLLEEYYKMKHIYHKYFGAKYERNNT